MQYRAPKTCSNGSTSKNTNYDFDISSLSLAQTQMLCGPLDEHLLLIEQRYRVLISRRGSHLLLNGKSDALALAVACLTQIIQSFEEKKHNTVEHIRSCIFDTKSLSRDSLFKKKCLIQNHAQGCYWDLMDLKTITFGIGPAGTGKTYLAVAKAVQAYQQGEVERIILTRPAVEAGEHLGFLPGDLQQKIDPYLRPLFDALIEFLGADHVHMMMQKQQIEMAPLAFMRGRTLSKSFIILDEAQNTTLTQMKLFLTRLGAGSKMVITGDISQIDLAQNMQSGLNHAIALLSQLDEIGFYFFKKNDIVRHQLITKILEAYGDV